MKAFIHKLREGAKSSAHQRAEDDANTNSTSSHSSVASTSSAAPRRSRANTQAAKVPRSQQQHLSQHQHQHHHHQQQQQQYHQQHAFQPPLPTSPALGGFVGAAQMPFQSSPSLSLPRHSPVPPKSPSRFKRFTSGNNNDSAFNHQSADLRKTYNEANLSVSSSLADMTLDGSTPATSHNTIRPSRSFKENPLSNIKDRFLHPSLAHQTSTDVSSVEHGAPLLRTPTQDSSHGLITGSIEDVSLNMGSGFSAMTVLSGTTEHSAGPIPAVRLVSRRNRLADGTIKDGNSSSSGSASSLTPRRSVDENNVSQQYRLLQAHGNNQQAPRPSSRSRARTVLQKLRRPLTAGSTRASDEPTVPSRPGFGFNKTSPAATNAAGQPSVPAVVPSTLGAALDPSIAHVMSSLPTDTPVQAQPLGSASFDLGVKRHRALLSGDPSSPTTPALPASPKSPTDTSGATHATGPRSSDESSAKELSILIADLIGPSPQHGHAPVDDIAAKAARIIDWAEQVAAKDRRPSVSHSLNANSTRSLGVRGMGLYSSALLRSIDYLEMLVDTQLTRSGEGVIDRDNVLAAFQHAKHLCTPIATPTTPVAAALPSDTFHTGFSPAINSAGLPLTPTSAHFALSRDGAGQFEQKNNTQGVHAPLSPESLLTATTPDVVSSLAALATPPESRKPIENVSPFVSRLSQTTEQKPAISLTPAPRRRRRPTTAPETGGGGVPSFGSSARLANGPSANGFGQREGFGAHMAQQSPRRPSIPPATAPAAEELETTVSGPATTSNNRRSIMHQPSLSYPGKGTGDADATEFYEGGGQLELLRSMTPSPAPFDAANMPRPFGVPQDADALRTGDRDRRRGGGGGHGGFPYNQSRPSTAQSVATITGSKSGSSSFGPHELFTPEAFRAGPRPMSRSGTANGASFSAGHTPPYLRQDANASQRSLAASSAASSHATGSSQGPPLPAGAAALGGLGIRISEDGDASTPVVRYKTSRASVRDADPQQQQQQQQHLLYDAQLGATFEVCSNAAVANLSSDSAGYDMYASAGSRRGSGHVGFRKPTAAMG